MKIILYLYSLYCKILLNININTEKLEIFCFLVIFRNKFIDFLIFITFTVINLSLFFFRDILLKKKISDLNLI